MRTNSACRSLLIIALALLGQGCALPASKHPLTDETTSKVDDRLLGNWQMVDDGQNNAASFKTVIARATDHPNCLQMTATQINSENGEKKEEADKVVPMFGAKIGDADYLSVDLKPDAKPEEKEYLILHYAIEGDVLRATQLDGEFVAKAIARGELNGSFKRTAAKASQPPGSGRLESVKVAAETKELAAFVAKHGRAAFSTEPITFKRVR